MSCWLARQLGIQKHFQDVLHEVLSNVCNYEILPAMFSMHSSCTFGNS